MNRQYSFRYVSGAAFALIVFALSAFLLSVSRADSRDKLTPAAVFVVNSTADTDDGVCDSATPGGCTLREAINAANANAGTDTIEFNLGSGTPSIAVGSSGLGRLPDITNPVIINGNTGGATRVELNGAAAGSSPTNDGLIITAGSSTIAGLVINRFGGSAIFLGANGGNTVENCYIGTSAAGNAALPNSLFGIFIASSDNLVGGTTSAARNVISGNGLDGVLIRNTIGNRVEGNYIGTDAAGSVAVGNRAGVACDGSSASNTIGGGAAGASNIISGNREDGVFLIALGSTIVQGNFIGLNATASAAVGNGFNGVSIRSSTNNNLIGGSVGGEGNFISGNLQNGIRIEPAPSGFPSNTRIEGNFIGTNISGTSGLGNALDGIRLDGASNNAIGGAVGSAGNVISGNGQNGIRILNGGSNNISQNIIGRAPLSSTALPNGQNGILIDDSTNNDVNANVIAGNTEAGVQIINPGANNNVLTRNLIGVVPGATPLGNRDGVVIDLGASNNSIGGSLSGAGNTIAFNGAFGIRITSGAFNTILSNSILSNGALGIELGEDGVTANDDCDTDSGANNFQNYPLLNAATTLGGATTIAGAVKSRPNTTYIIEFFSSAACDPTGRGEGELLIGSTTVTTDASCNAEFVKTISPAIAIGRVITATATEPDKDTSEFSACRQVLDPTAVEFASARATGYDEGVVIEWQTGFEVDNLGFRLYREQAGERVLITRDLVAGSALLAGPGTRLAAGRHYLWADRLPREKQDAVYWIEDIDLNGQCSWHGPVGIQNSELRIQNSILQHHSRLLSDLASDKTRGAGPDCLPVERAALLPKTDLSQTQLQSSIASRPSVKIAVNREGWHRVTAQQLVQSGLDPGVDPRFLQLFVDGRELPFSVAGEQDGRLDQTDSIEFYGTGLDTASTDRRTYWLVAGSEPGKRIRVAQAGAGQQARSSFPYQVERKDRTIYFSALRNGERENFFGAVVAATPVDLSLTIQRVDKSSESDAQLDVTLQGVTWATHRVSVNINGEDLGEVSFSGQDQGARRLRLSQSLLREGENRVRLAAKGGATDVSLVDSIRLTYWHTFTAESDALRFTLEGGQRASIDGFTSNEIKVIDITDTEAPYEVIGEIERAEAGHRVSVAATGAGQRTLLAFAIDQARTPARVSANAASDLRHAGQGANLLIITRHELRDSLDPLAALRRRQGLSVMIVDVEDVYDEFAFGNKTPHAIKEFLGFARTNWKKPPSFILFAGDASLDPKNYLGGGDFDIVPTKLLDTDFLETASDEWLADFNSDGLAEMALGRLPFRTTDEADLIVSKLIDYDRSSPSQEVLVVADENDGYDFEAANAGLRELIPASITMRQIDRGRLDPVTAKAQLIEAVTRGQKIINYAGHGSVDLWRGSLLTSTDASRLENGERQPVFVMMTCLNGYFQDAGIDSLAEALIKAERGGAVAVWASTGMTMPNWQEVMNREFYRLLFNGRSAMTIGEAARMAKEAIDDRDVRQTWVLLGDPTMRLR